MGRIDRKSSIENEPRTLPVDQIHYAREAALYVMNTRSVEEAVTIFTEGLEPVVCVAKDANRRRRDLDLDFDFGDETQNANGHHHHHIPLREVLSAPF